MSISSTLLGGADIRFHPAAPELQPHVGCFWIITARAGAIMRLVPDGTTSIAFEQKIDRGLTGYLRGPLLEPAELVFSVPTTLIGVRLRPGVAFNLTRVPVHHIGRRRVPLAEFDLLHEFVSVSEHALAPDARIALLQRLLSQRLQGSSIHPVVSRALEKIHADRGCVSVADVAVRCDTSERHLSRVMRDWIGYGPKRYAAIVRFQQSLTGMERVPRSSMAAIATETGYFDQSHMYADVSRFAGATPGDLIETGVSDFSKTQCDVPF
ncbi:MAG TPA: helix-turn-helix domain-containing protein [Steroidobacteraceae bacterium]|nr:helix-turn-helix domain-containing protein [Steroidobacteraceae bacterium]